MSVKSFLDGCGIVCALGTDRGEVRSGLKQGISPGMVERVDLLNSGRTTVVGAVTWPLSSLPLHLSWYDCRNHRLALAALEQIRPQVERALNRFGPERVAVVVGTSTGAIAEGELALAYHHNHGEFPEDYHYRLQEIGTLGEFVARVFGLAGLVYTLSTACSSSARAFISAQQLLDADLADAVLVGGADSLCGLTLNGFDALESLSSGLCKPFCADRNGINIGEGAAFTMLTKEPAAVRLLGWGHSSDAYHLSAPEPSGRGAEVAMRMALNEAGLSPGQVGYINAHGTGTPLNDVMESAAIYRIFGDKVPVSSTKSLTGHTLGAAGAIEMALCWMILESESRSLPCLAHDTALDPALAPVWLARGGEVSIQPRILSNSFAFGGNNVSLLLGRCRD